MNIHKGFAKDRQSGFTVLELLIVVAIVGMMSVIVVESVRTFVPRFELEQAAGQTQQLIMKARIEAVKRGVRTVIEADLDERMLRAFVDMNGNPNNPLDPNGRYLVFDPDDTLPEKRTDYMIGWTALPGKPATGSQFGGPKDGIRGADSIEGFTPIPSAPPTQPAVLVFRASGAVRDAGAFRFSDSRGANHLETAVSAVIGNVEIRKYLQAADSPTGVAKFFAEANDSFADGSGRTVGRNIWVWY